MWRWSGRALRWPILLGLSDRCGAALACASVPFTQHALQKKFTLETDMTGKLALHRIVTKQSQDHRNEQHGLILNTVPSPDTCFLTRPEEKLCHKYE
jgi:hypothetical protein